MKHSTTKRFIKNIGRTSKGGEAPANDLNMC